MQKTIFILPVIFMLLANVVHMSGKASVSGTDDITEDIEQYFDFEDIEQLLEGKEESVNFTEIVKAFAKGDTKSGADKFVDIIRKNLFLELSVNKEAIRKILALAFVTALFSNFAGIFKNSQVSDMGFLICYVAIMTYLLGSFAALSYIAYEVMKNTADFMQALLPVYAVSVGVSDGQANAASYYEMALGVIGIAEFVSIKLLFPAINIYTGLSMVNHLGKEDYLSKTCDLIKSVVNFSVKTMLTIVMGLNIIQKMFSPLSGGIGGNAARNVINTISGISLAGNGIAELLYGTGRIVKSTIGGAGVVVLCVIMLVPLIKMIVFVLSYQLSGAIVQPVSDKRITKCITCVNEGAVMLLHVVFAVMLMFVVTIAIICIG